MRNYNKKGQFFAADALASMIAFFILFLFLAYLTTLNAARLNEEIVNDEMQIITFQVSDMLTKSWGSPNNWELDPDNTRIIGLKHNPGSLDKNKVNQFINMNYNDTKSLFKINRYDYLFKLNSNSTSIEFGVSPSSQANFIVSTQRFLVYGNETARMELIFWH